MQKRFTERVPRRGARVFRGLHEDAELHSEVCQVQEHGEHRGRPIAVDPEEDSQVRVGGAGQSLPGNGRRSEKSDPESGGKIRRGRTQQSARRYPNQKEFPVLSILFSEILLWIGIILSKRKMLI